MLHKTIMEVSNPMLPQQANGKKKQKTDVAIKETIGDTLIRRSNLKTNRADMKKNKRLRITGKRKA